MFRNPEGLLKYPFIVPGDCYGIELWDWDSWLTNVALRQIAPDDAELYRYEKGSILNFLINTDKSGKMHEYYNPETGEPVNNMGFQSWNLLVCNMIAYLNGEKRIKEF